MTDKLKPCPFCGCKAVLALGNEHFTIPVCSSCGARLPAQFGEDSLATSAWNTRYVPSLKWLKQDGNAWECPNCHAVFELDSGNPEDKYLNYCPVCGMKLELPE